MEKRLILALTLSFLVLGFYPVVLQKFYPDYYKKSKAQQAQPSQKKEVVPALTPDIRTPAALLDAAKDTEFQNRNLKLLFNTEAAVIRDVSFPKFLDPDTSTPLKFLSVVSSDLAPTAVWISGASEEERPPSQVSVDMNHVRTASTFMGGRLKVSKDYAFQEGYAAALSVHFQNVSAEPLEFSYELVVGPDVPPRNGIDSQYTEANFYSEVDGKPVLRHEKESKKGKSARSEGILRWVATKDRHFSVIVKPKTEDGFTGVVEGLGNHHFKAALVSQKLKLSPQESKQHEFSLYIGPNSLEELTPLGLDPLVNFGKMDMIGKLLVGGLEMLHGVSRNWGLAIIALTLIINLLLFPLTRASFMSMKRMQLVQPHMQKLKEQHKKSPEKLNKEMMGLYKKHKVNPFGGCLPMVLQMPIFIALYVALSKSVILINARFLWIKDLSSPDRVPLPFSLPFLGNQIHALPLIMVGAMVFQQKLTQVKMEVQDPQMEAQQRMMAVMMPILFGFIFYGMPSGLVLYWLVNTLVMTLYQLRLKKITLT